MKRFLMGTLMVLLGIAACAQTQADYAFLNAPYSAAKDFVTLLAAGSFQRAYGMVAEDARGDYSPEVLSDGWVGLLEQYGNYRDMEVSGADIEGDRWTVHVLVTFDKAKVDVALGFNSIKDQEKVLSVSYRRNPGDRRP